MAHLDYAYLADYAVVQGGKLTAVGASFTYVQIPQAGVAFSLSVAGRITASESVDTVRLGLRFVAPDDAYALETESEITPGGEIRPYRGKVGLLFAASVMLVLVSTGLYVVELAVDGEHARRLAFEVALPAEPG